MKALPCIAVEDEYLVTVPLFDVLEWTQKNGRVVTIRKTGMGRNLQKIIVIGKEQSRYFIPHELFQNGGEIEVKTTAGTSSNQ